MTRKEAIDILRVINPPRETERVFDEFIQARDMAIKALEEPQWILCSEQLPELYTEVLVTDGKYVGIADLSQKSGEEYIWLFKTCWNDLEKWPYWMPLPEPPKEGDAE